jgi:hypothetical protein
MADTGERVPVGEVLRQFASVYDGLDEANALVGNEQVECLPVTERDVILSLVRGAWAKLQDLESKLNPSQPHDESQALDAVDTTGSSAAALDVSTLVTFVPLESIELGVNGHGSPEGLGETTDVSPVKEAPEVAADSFEDPSLPVVAEAHDPVIEVLGPEPVPVLGAAVAVSSPENLGDETSSGTQDEKGAELLTERQTSLVRLSPEKLAQHEQENMAALGGNRPVVEFTIVDDLGIRTSIREIRFRLARNGEPNMMLTVVNTLLDQLIGQQRADLTGAELQRLTGYETNRIADNYGTWSRKFNVTPFLTRGFGDKRVYYLNPLYSFGDERQSSGDVSDPVLVDTVMVPTEAENLGIDDSEDTEAPAPILLPDPEVVAPVADIAINEIATSLVEVRSLTENGPVQLTNWGLEWTTKGGHSLALLNGKAMIPMKPLMADVLAFTAQSGGSVVYTDLLEALERRYPDLQPPDLMSALGQFEALFAHHAIGDKFVNEIVSKTGTAPIRLVTLAGVVVQPEGRDFLVSPTQMAS